MLELIELSTPYRDSFLTSLRDLQADGQLLRYDLATVSADFDAFVHALHEQKDRANIAANRVPGVDYWLYEDHAILLGHLSLRYELNDALLQVGGHIGYQICPAYRRQGYGKAILRLGLEKARACGLRRVLVTCDETNIGSQRIIEANGGLCENGIVLEGDPIRKLRYWIDLSS